MREGGTKGVAYVSHERVQIGLGPEVHNFLRAEGSQS